jgi:hypothetical protein
VIGATHDLWVPVWLNARSLTFRFGGETRFLELVIPAEAIEGSDSLRRNLLFVVRRLSSVAAGL